MINCVNSTIHHENSVIGENVTICVPISFIGLSAKSGKIIIGDNVTLREFTVVNAPGRGLETVIQKNCHISCHNYIERGSTIKENSVLSAGVKIGSGSTIGAYSVLYFNSCVLDNTTLPAYSYLEANSTFTSKDSASGIVWSGSPATPKYVIPNLTKLAKDNVGYKMILAEADAFLAWWRSRNLR